MAEEKNDVDKLVEMLSKVFVNIKIKDIMTSPPIVVTEETKLKYVKDIMRIKKISGMPVITRNQNLSGIISIEDIIKVYDSGSFNDRTVNWMTKNPVFLNEDDTLMSFLEANEKLNYGRYPVINRNKKVVGVVTKLDILEWMFKKLGYIYVHDQRREETLNKRFTSLLTGEQYEETRIDFRYDIDYESVEMVGIAATKLKKFLLSKYIKNDVVRKVSIATYEAEANIVIHSGSNGVLYCIINNDHVKVFLEDYGKGIENLDKAMKEGFSTATEKIREKGFGAGMGLPNMKRFSDRMTLISSPNKGVKVEMLFYI